MNLLKLLPFVALVFLLGCMKEEETDQQKQMNREDELLQQYIKNHNIPAELDALGYYYAVLKENPSGKKVSSRDIIAFKYKISLLNGDIIEDNDTIQKAMHNTEAGVYNYNRAIVPAALDFGLAYMKEGEKFLFLLPSYLAYWQASQKDVFPSYANFAIEIELIDILTPEEEKAAEKDSIDAYIEANELTDVQSFASGLHYVLTEEGTGEKPTVGQRVTVNYTGELLNGHEFDKTDPEEPFSFVLGQGQRIKGWDEGIALMKKGEHATLIIPSHLAYGQSVFVLPKSLKASEIPPFAPLVFQVELVDIQ